MAVQIGTLVLRGQFGESRSAPEDDPRDTQNELDALRRTILRDVKEMMAQAERRARER